MKRSFNTSLPLSLCPRFPCASAQQCTIPFTYQNNSYEDCTVFDGTEQCMVTDHTVAGSDGQEVVGTMQVSRPRQIFQKKQIWMAREWLRIRL